MATFGTLVTRLQDHFSTGTGAATRHLNQLLEWHRRVLSMPEADLWRLTTLTTTYTASATSMALPVVLSRIDHVVSTTGNLPLEAKSLAWWRSLPPRTAVGGAPLAYVVLGRTPVTTQPASTGIQTWVQSHSASDTAVVANLRIILIDGTTGAATATLNGLTRVRLGTWTGAMEITDFHLSTAAVGRVALYDAQTDGNMLGFIPVGKLNAWAYRVALVPSPSAATVIQIDGQRSIDTGLGTSDEPWIPEEWQYLLELGARCLEYERQDDGRYAAARRELEAELKRFKWFCVSRPDYRPVPDPQVIQTSNLGPYFAPGRW